MTHAEELLAHRAGVKRDLLPIFEQGHAGLLHQHPGDVPQNDRNGVQRQSGLSRQTPELLFEFLEIDAAQRSYHPSQAYSLNSARRFTAEGGKRLNSPPSLSTPSGWDSSQYSLFPSLSNGSGRLGSSKEGVLPRSGGG